MALGDMGKALRIVSMQKGWDPNVIEGSGENIGNFNKAPDPWKLGNQSVGTLPEGTPDNFPESVTPMDVEGQQNWQFPTHSDGNAPTRHTTGADPFPAKPGAA